MALPPITPVDLSSDFQLPALDTAEQAEPSGGSFGGKLAEAIGKLEATQAEADSQARALAAGTATDVSSVVLAVSKASLSLELAAQIRNKAVEAYQDIFRMQV